MSALRKLLLAAAAVLAASAAGPSLAFAQVPTSYDTSADLETIAGDGASIGEYYVNNYTDATAACDAMCQQLQQQLANANAQEGSDGNGAVTDEAQADSEAFGVAEDVGGVDEGAEAASAFPEVGAAVAAGTAGIAIGTAIDHLFGLPTFASLDGTDNSGQWGPGPFYPATVVYIETYAQHGPACPAGDQCIYTSGSNGTNVAAIGPNNGWDQRTDIATIYNDVGTGFFLLSNAGEECYGSCPELSGADAAESSSGVYYAYQPASPTPEPSGWQPTGGPPEQVTPEPSTTPAAAGAAILQELNSDPTDNRALIKQMAAAHNATQTKAGNTGANTGGGVAPGSGGQGSPGTSTVTTGTATGTETDTDSSSDTQTQTETQTTETATTGTATVPPPQPGDLTIPQITTGESGTDYYSKLEGLGFTDVQTHTLTGDEVDLQKGPDAAVSVDPAAGTSVAPGALVEVQTNPDDSPDPGSSGTAPVGPSPPGLNFPSVGTPCTVFPFGVPCWLISQLHALTANAVAPSFSVGVPHLLGGGSMTIDMADPFGFDLSSFMGIFRLILLALSFVGIVMWLAGMAMGGGTGGGGEAAAED